MRLMVIDDEPDARELLKDLLEPLGAVVDVAASAGEAFDRLLSEPYTAIISDVGMPEADGLSLVRRLREHEQYRFVPAIALSAYAAIKDREEALRAGFDAHLKKPLDMAELLATLTALMARNSAVIHRRSCA
jgi:CheY-like chemotaxis protein